MLSTPANLQNMILDNNPTFNNHLQNMILDNNPTFNNHMQLQNMWGKTTATFDNAGEKSSFTTYDSPSSITNVYVPHNAHGPSYYQ